MSFPHFCRRIWTSKMLLCDGVAAAMLGAAVIASFGWHDGQERHVWGRLSHLQWNHRCEISWK